MRSTTCDSGSGCRGVGGVGRGGEGEGGGYKIGMLPEACCGQPTKRGRAASAWWLVEGPDGGEQTSGGGEDASEIVGRYRAENKRRDALQCNSNEPSFLLGRYKTSLLRLQ